MSEKKPDTTQMSASEIAIRKFLKQLGVTTHQQIEDRLHSLIADGTVVAGDTLTVSATITIPELDLTHQIQADLILPAAADRD